MVEQMEDAERERTLKHFDAHSDYWFDVYTDGRSYAAYTLMKQHRFVMDYVTRLPEGAAILDVGCGAGYTVIELARAGYAANGIDFAPQMIERARQEAETRDAACDFRVGAVERLPYGDGAFDAVFGLGLLGNLRDEGPALREIQRVLKPGGCALLTAPNILALDLMVALPRSLPIYFLGTPLRKHIRTAGNALRRLMGRPAKDASTLTFGRLVRPGALVKRMRAHGFSDVTTTALTYGPLLPLGIRRGDDAARIRRSEALAAWAMRTGRLRWAGTSMMYVGIRE